MAAVDTGSSESAWRVDIEGLRGVAILMVVAYHARVPFTTGGYTGVDVFFVISGYVIAGQLSRQLSRSGRIDLLDFYARRARRLLPAAALMLLATILASRFLLAPLEQAAFSGSAIAASLYSANFWFAKQDTNYLGAPVESDPFLHMWSISVEEQFYLFWPILLLAGWRLGTRVGAVAVTSSICLLSVWLMLYLNNAAPEWTFFGPHTRAWEFGMGALAALLPWTIPAAVRIITSWVGLAAIVGACVGFDDGTPYPGIATLVPVAGTALVLVGRDHWATATLGRLRKIGRVSYSWYLWHWPVMVFLVTLLPDVTLTGRIGAVLASFACAVAAQAVVEDPIRFSTRLMSRPGVTLRFAALLTAAIVSVTLIWQRVLHHEGLDPRQALFVEAREDHPAISTTGCHLSIEATEISDCRFGDRESNVIVVLYGDSHAAQWFPALEAVSISEGWQLVTLTKMACPATSIAVSIACERWRGAAMIRLRSLKPALVFMASASVYLAEPGRRAGVSDSTWLTHTTRTLEELQPLRTVVILEAPQPGFDPAMCLARQRWHPWLGTNCTFANAAGSDVDRAARIGRVAAAPLSHVRVVDLSEEVCPRTPCDPWRNDFPVFRDSSHVTATFSRSLAPRLAAKVNALTWP